MIIRPARLEDIAQIEGLLYQVHQVHAELRPDLFLAGGKKYTTQELEIILTHPTTPVFVAVEEGIILGYAFCILQTVQKEMLTAIKTLYLDDLCVGQATRGKRVGTQLYDYVVDYAKQQGCYNLTFNVWEGNHAAEKFYQKRGMKVQKTVMEQIL